MSEILDSNIIEQLHPDFIPVSWDIDFTLVRWEERTGERGGKEKHCVKLRKYTKLVKDVPKEQRPDVTFHPMPVQENMLALLTHYGIELKYNVITNKIDIFNNGVLDEQDLDTNAQTIWDFCEKHNWKLTKDRVRGLCVSIAHNFRYNPIKEYFEEVHAIYYPTNREWVYDTNAEIDKLLNTLPTTLDRDLLGLYITHFMLQMAVLGTEDESSFTEGQLVLVLKGIQNAGKTTWFKKLLPERLQNNYFTGGRQLDLSNKDDKLETISNWLTELGEIGATFRKADIDLLKGFITNGKDRVRKPYAPEYIDKKRRVSLCGTVNDEEFLRDVTGSRRFLVIPLTAPIERDFSVNIDAIWAFIYQWVLQNKEFKTEAPEHYWNFAFTPEETAMIEISNQPYKVTSKEQEQLEMYLDLFPEREAPPLFPPEEEVPQGGNWYTSRELAEYIALKAHHTEDKLSPVVIGRTLKKIGVQYRTERANVIKFLVQKI